MSVLRLVLISEREITITIESEEKSIWLRIPCEGDLSRGLDDWETDEDRIRLYNPEKAPANSLSDALVPYIPYDQLDKEATQFLKDNYPEALKITPHGEKPVFVDLQKIAEKIGLTVEMKRIKEDTSVFGQEGKLVELMKDW